MRYKILRKYNTNKYTTKYNFKGTGNKTIWKKTKKNVSKISKKLLIGEKTMNMADSREKNDRNAKNNKNTVRTFKVDSSKTRTQEGCLLSELLFPTVLELLTEANKRKTQMKQIQW